MQVGRELLDTQDKTVENRIAEFSRKTDTERTGGNGGILNVISRLPTGRIVRCPFVTSRRP